jgi:hypothetical protein
MLLAVCVVAASKLGAVEFFLKTLDLSAHQNSGIGLAIKNLDPGSNTGAGDQ